MKVRRIATIMLRQIYLLRGSPTRVLPLFAWIAIDVMLWGFITRYLNAIASPGFDFVPAMLGAVLLWDFLSRVMQGVTMAFFEDVWSRNLLAIFASPLSRAEYVSGLVLTGICTSLLGLVVMIALASLAFGLSFIGYGLAIIPGLIVLFLFGIALGVAGSAMVLRLGPAAEWLIWPLPAVLSPFASVLSAAIATARSSVSRARSASPISAYARPNSPSSSANASGGTDPRTSTGADSMRRRSNSTSIEKRLSL